MHTILSAITECLQAQNCVLATVISSSGSTPRSSGAHMLICPDQKFYGTVGGGLVEAKVQEAATDFLAGDLGGSMLLPYILDNKQAGALGMSCGGALTVLLERLTPAQRDEFIALEEAVIKGNIISREAYYVQNLDRWDRTTADTVAANNAYATQLQAIKKAASEHISEELPLLHTEDTVQYFSETYHPPATVIIAGAGHVAQPTAQIAHIAGFSVIVLDDRDDFANAERFPNAHVQVVESLDDILSEITVHKDCYVVIVTRGHEHDKTVLQQMLTTPAKYIGMIGSKSKRDGLYERLREEGVTDEAIARCHCPIGLPLGGRTPEEIGVSIMAEIIQVKSQG